MGTQNSCLSSEEHSETANQRHKRAKLSLVPIMHRHLPTRMAQGKLFVILIKHISFSRSLLQGVKLS
jgi:hypothetical protein